MNTTTITSDNLEALNLPVDQSAEAVPGCVVYRWATAFGPATLTVWPDDDRGAFATNADSQWGAWDGDKLTMDDGTVVVPGSNPYTPCCYEGCEKPGTDHDHEGDLACAEHAVKSERWVILVDSLGEKANWVTAEMASAIVSDLEVDGWSVTIREARRGESAGYTYAAKQNGDLQIYTHTPELLKLAIDEAYNRAC